MPTEDSDTEKEKKEQKRLLERKTASNHITYYANNAQIEGTYWDLRLSFGQIIEASEKALVTEDAVTIQMSPQLAKRLSAILVDNVKKYEERFGVIPPLPE